MPQSASPQDGKGGGPLNAQAPTAPEAQRITSDASGSLRAAQHGGHRGAATFLELAIGSQFQRKLDTPRIAVRVEILLFV
jgi:hypothetical protein